MGAMGAQSWWVGVILSLGGCCVRAAKVKLVHGCVLGILAYISFKITSMAIA